MVSEYVYSPHVDFFIDRVDRDTGYEMASFHIHHKYEIYYEIEGSRRYFIEDAAYIVNAGSVVLIGENQIHKTAALGDGASSRIVVNFSREYLDKITDLFPEVDFFSFLSEEHNHLLSTITVKQQNIKAAQIMIEKSNESISDIAEKTGFMTTAHFRRVFKDATGLSPQQYRQYYKRVNK